MTDAWRGSYDAWLSREPDYDTADPAYQSIRQILETVGVSSWEKLPGALVRVEDNGPGRTLTKIGHIMEDRWFDIEEWMAPLRVSG